MSRKRFVKIIVKLLSGFIVVIYLTTSGTILGYNKLRAYIGNSAKYTITNKYTHNDGLKLKAGLNTFDVLEASDNINCLYFVYFNSGSSLVGSEFKNEKPSTKQL